MNQKVKKTFSHHVSYPPDPENPAVFRFGASALETCQFKSKHRLLAGPPVINKRWQLRVKGT